MMKITKFSFLIMVSLLVILTSCKTKKVIHNFPMNAVTDYDGNTYEYIKIGNQIWMSENLKTTHYADGKELIDGTGVGDIKGNYDNKYYFSYNENPDSASIYGYLYTWPAIMNETLSSNINPSGIQGVCPDGWHLPSVAEWVELIEYLKGWNVAGGKMKEIGVKHWISPNTGADNKSKFSALPAGNRYYDGNFHQLGNNTFFWSSTEKDRTSAEAFKITHDALEVTQRFYYKNYGFSVRCIKNQ